MSDMPQNQLLRSEDEHRTLSNDLASLGLGFLCCYAYMFCLWIFCVQVPRFLPDIPDDDASIVE
jgi:hypothetical protein